MRAVDAWKSDAGCGPDTAVRKDEPLSPAASFTAMTDQPTPLHPALLDASHIALSYGRHGQAQRE